MDIIFYNVMMICGIAIMSCLAIALAVAVGVGVALICKYKPWDW